jgi:hypothetical protein
MALVELAELRQQQDKGFNWAAVPVPEPATLALMVMGVLGVYLLGRRGKN